VKHCKKPLRKLCSLLARLTLLVGSATVAIRLLNTRLRKAHE
jgi:hypothetical protein